MLPYLLNAPQVVVLTLVTVYPLAAMLVLSGYDWNLAYPGRAWVGLQNYVDLLSESRFLNAVVRSILFAVAGTAVQVLLGLGIALLLYTGVRGFQVYQVALMIPMMVSPMVAALTWRFMLNSTFGVINYFCERLGFGSVSFLGDPRLVLPTAVAVDTWQWTPYVMLVLFAALQALPAEPLEAALIEGATVMQRVRHILVPLIRPHVVAVATLRLIMSLKVFDLIWGMTQGGPLYASETLYPYIFHQGFLYFKVGYAAAAGVLFVALMVGGSAGLSLLRGRSQ